MHHSSLESYKKSYNNKLITVKSKAILVRKENKQNLLK